MKHIGFDASKQIVSANHDLRNWPLIASFVTVAITRIKRKCVHTVASVGFWIEDGNQVFFVFFTSKGFVLRLNDTSLEVYINLEGLSFTLCYTNK